MFLAIILLSEVALMLGDIANGTIVEGIGNDALALFTLVMVSCIACIISYFMRQTRVAQIHPDLAGDVQGFRDSFARGHSGRVNDTRRVEVERPDAVHTCPICYDNALFPTLTNCGHVFCCECIMGYWRHSSSLVSPVKCAICRTEITVLLPVNWPVDEENSRLRENNIGLNDYNRRFSGDRPVRWFFRITVVFVACLGDLLLQWLEYLWDLPVLIPYVIRSLFDFNGLMIMFRLRVVFIALGIFAYVLSPFDIIPESAYGLIGLIDDLFVAVLLLVYIAIAIRHVMARRGEVPQE
ncbi:zinc finger, C3HC4 type [Cooperia oncophora]